MYDFDFHNSDFAGLILPRIHFSQLLPVLYDFLKHPSGKSSGKRMAVVIFTNLSTWDDDGSIPGICKGSNSKWTRKLCMDRKIHKKDLAKLNNRAFGEHGECSLNSTGIARQPDPRSGSHHHHFALST